jgi:hypothetical protein
LLDADHKYQHHAVGLFVGYFLTLTWKLKIFQTAVLCNLSGSTNIKLLTNTSDIKNRTQQKGVRGKHYALNSPRGLTRSDLSGPNSWASTRLFMVQRTIH